MRMGSDSGRNFLSTEDPVKSRIKRENPVKTDSTSKADRSLNVNEILGRFFIGRKTKR